MKAAFSLVLASLFAGPAFAAKPSAAPPPAPVVFAKAVQSTAVFDSLIYPARLVSRVNATLMAETEGIVKAINRRLGTRVKVGQSILTLINPDPVYTFAPFEVQSPVSGTISALWVTQGSRVSKGEKLGSITDPEQVQATIEVTVSDLSAIHIGLEGQLELSDNGQHLKVQVTGISPLIDPATGTASAELKVLDKKRLPPPGQVGRVRFRARSHQGIQLPESAVFYRAETPVVRVMDGDKAIFREVKLGPARQGHFEILEGLKPGETVVLRTNTFIADGETVTLQKGDEDKT